LFGHVPKQGTQVIQTALRQAIEELKPAANVPTDARVWRIYSVLYFRYVQHLTQEEAAHRLNITPRHLRREQREAVLWLAQHLREQRQKSAQKAQSTAWRSQVRQDLASLQQHTPGAIADVCETIASSISLGRALASKRQIELENDVIPARLYAAIHPIALRQILLTAIEKLIDHMTTGTIAIAATVEGGELVITVTGRPVIVKAPPVSDFIEETVAAQGGSVQTRVIDEGLRFEITLPLVSRIRVLVVEDNTDLVHFYRRYTANTRYEIEHIAEGKDLFAAIEANKPDVIVLDVMLPDIDGWELLNHLHEHPTTRDLPVVVCSVVRREALAKALGATYYMAKPVRRQEFIQALDQALHPPS
jgi:CheY-like chemotaxis protein